MNPEDMAILDDFMKVRNIQPQTIYNYRQSIKNYTTSQGLTLKQLLEEAEREEEERIRLKNRTLKKRLITHRNYLINEKGCSSSTIQKQMGQLKTIYHHYEIEIPKLPKFNDRNVKQIEEIYYDDLPTKDIIKEAIRVSNPLMTAIILFICSSGCARKEVTNLKISDFITATQEYHNCTDIQDVITELKKQTDIVPIFKLKRAKTNKYYYTFVQFFRKFVYIKTITIFKKINHSFLLTIIFISPSTTSMFQTRSSPCDKSKLLTISFGMLVLKVVDFEFAWLTFVTNLSIIIPLIIFFVSNILVS